MAFTPITTTLPNRTQSVFRGAAPKFAHKTLKNIMCTAGSMKSISMAAAK